MEKKDCKIIFTNKQTYDFKFEDLTKAIKWSQDKNANQSSAGLQTNKVCQVWAIKTPFGIFQPMDEEMFENTYDAIMGDHQVFPDSTQEDLK